MRAVVVYESMYGNTHLVADAIGAGLSTIFDVRVVPVVQASPAVLADADLVVVGGPTHAHGMSRAATRKAAVEAANKPIGGLTVEPDALGPGLRDWFGSLGRYPVQAAAFDTRVHGPAALTGRASKTVTRLLREHGFDVAAEPESFLVTKQDRLEPHETARAREWGTKLAAGVAPGQGLRSDDHCHLHRLTRLAGHRSNRPARRLTPAPAPPLGPGRPPRWTPPASQPEADQRACRETDRRPHPGDPVALLQQHGETGLEDSCYQHE